jgi:hypothetical protein
MISAELHQHARAELRRTGANGVGVTLEELCDEGSKSDDATSGWVHFSPDHLRASVQVSEGTKGDLTSETP